MPWMCIYENPGGIIISNTKANNVLSFKLNFTSLKWNYLFPSVSRVVLQHEFCEKISGFC